MSETPELPDAETIDRIYEQAKKAERKMRALYEASQAISDKSDRKIEAERQRQRDEQA